MSTFIEAQGIEAEALFDLIPFIERRYSPEGIVKTNSQLHVQKYKGDAIILTVAGGKFVELKAEKENIYGNLFIETWSNRSRFTQGWIFTTQADWLWYYFVSNKQLYHVVFQELKKWCFGIESNQGRIWDFPEKQQNKYSQLNDTWGRCIPIQVLKQEVKTFIGPHNPTIIESAIDVQDEIEEYHGELFELENDDF